MFPVKAYSRRCSRFWKAPSAPYRLREVASIPICGGAFVDLDKVIQRRLGNHVLGFGAQEQQVDAMHKSREALKHVEPEDLLSYGFIPEFIGRLPMITALEELTKDQLVAILTDTKNALTKQYQKLLWLEGVELEFTKDALQELPGHCQGYRCPRPARSVGAVDARSHVRDSRQ